ncbi:LacI family transcriptional regulator [Massilia sp. Mn16-1_5]|nr:LacI family transcriptional regulator [Massilia sp. Mn16-1_5]
MLGLFSLCHTPAIAQPETYPSRPVRIFVPFAPGGSNDVVARLVGERLSQIWKQPVIVENKPGAGGNIGAEAVAKSPKDGYTLLLSGNSLACINPQLYKNAKFDGVNDLPLVTPLGFVPIVLVVNPLVPVKTVAELIAYGRKQAGGLSYGSGGAGTPQHLSGEMFKAATGLNLMHVPYKGNMPALTDLMAGQIDVMFSPINSVASLIKAGKVRAIAAAGARRMADFPDLPTIAESGVPGYDSSLWLALAAPKDTPKAITDKLDQEVRKILGETQIKDKLAQQGIVDISAPPAEFRDMVRKDCARWARVIKEAKVSAD